MRKRPTNDGNVISLGSLTPGPVFERTVRGDGVDLHVTERGALHAPTVVLVHGYPDNQSVWDAIATELAAHYHVVTFDVRGAGRSGTPKRLADFAMDRLSNDLRAVCDAVAPGKGVHLVGHDWGSIHSWESVTDPSFEGKVLSFTSISGPCLDHVGMAMREHLVGGPRGLGKIGGQLSRSWYILLFQLPFLPEAAWHGGFAKAIPRFLAKREGIPRDEARERSRLSDGTNGIGLYRRNMLERLLFPRDRRTDIPVQIVVPEGDPAVSPWLTESVDKFVPNLHRRVVRGGHWLPLSRPKDVARYVDEMVRFVEQGSESPSFRRLRGARARRRLVLVTGGGSGIGRATCLLYAKAGDDIVVVDKDGDAARRVAGECAAIGATANAYAVDVSTERENRTLRDGVLAREGVPDVLVLNAGIGLAGRFFDTTARDWDDLLAVNVLGVVHGARLFGEAMRARGEGGHIVVTASAAAFAPGKSLPAYGVSKRAALMVAECLRAELAEDGIGVSAICPGIVDTPITRRTRFAGRDEAEESRARDEAAKLYALRGVGPEVVAEAIARAVEEDLAVVPVNVEAHVLHALSRAAPSFVRWLGTFDPPGTRPKARRVRGART